MSTQPAKPTSEKNLSIVFGMGQNDKACGARFSGVDPQMLIDAARKACFKYFAVDTPELVSLAKQIPAGRVLGGGKLVIPPIKKELYAALLDQMDEEDFPPDASLLDPAHPSPHPRPKTWDEIAEGHLVIAQASVAYGWWEAVVTHRANDVLTMQWVHYPRMPEIQQHVSSVALTPVPHKPAGGLQRS